MIPNYGADVYKKVSEITNLKFKAQINGSGIVFKKLVQVTDLVTGDWHYVLFTENESFGFTNQQEFIKGFIKNLKNSIDKLNKEFDELQRQSQQTFVDDNWIYMEHERIGCCGEKQSKLLNKIRDIQVRMTNEDN